MPFTDQQIRRLKAPLRGAHVKAREADGKTLHYLEGWHVVAEANRIFGFDGWDRETVASQCVWQKQTGSGYAVAYLTRVKVSVRAGPEVIVREGLGSGEATALTPGAAHDRAAKAAETDATKRALSTFGNPFGLSLYSGEPPRARRRRSDASEAPSRRLKVRMEREPAAPHAVSAPAAAGPALRNATGLARIEKSQLALSEPKRLRDPEHLKFIARQPCLLCGRTPSQAHHIRFAQPRALSRKVSDEFTVPLCALHHQELHMRGDERAWWAEKNFDPLATAETLWRATRSGAAMAGAIETDEARDAAGEPEMRL